MGDIKKKILIEILEVKTITQEMNYALARNNSRLDIVDKKISELEDITIGTIQNETERKHLEEH